MQHRNAPLTPSGRRRLLALVEEEHLTLEAAAASRCRRLSYYVGY